MTALPLSRTERRNRVAIFGAGLLAFGLLFFWPMPKSAPIPTICVFHQVTGLPCAFCGGTRAARCLVQQDWRGAWYYNPLIYAVPPAAALLGAGLLAEALLGRQLFRRPSRLTGLALAGGLILLLLAWWAWHVYDAISTPKPELADTRRGLVRFLHANLGK